MKIPYVIDNRDQKLADVLNYLLGHFQSRSLDVATAYFTISGFQLIQQGLEGLGSFRLLLGAEPSEARDVGMRPDPALIAGRLRGDLEAEPFREETLRLVEDLVAFVRRPNVQVRLVRKGFLHAKCYLLYGDKPTGDRFLFDRFQPLIGIVGSSNFTGPGLTSNRELNLSHRVLLDAEEGRDPDAANMVVFLGDEKASARITEQNRQLLKSEVGARAILELVEWFDREWEEAEDFKEGLIELLDASKFGEKEYTPYQVYMKALFEYFRGDLAAQAPAGVRSAIDLAEFQEDAVKKARKILAMYDGVMVADSVGLGKTWIGKKLLEDFAYHQRMKALVVCPASLRQMWQDELADATIAARIISQEELGREEFDIGDYGETDVILVEESHNFRNRKANRYGKLEEIINRNGGRGQAGERKRLILVTATPINNDLMDLYNQLALITQGDRGYFAAAGIGDLYRYFLRARREQGDGRLGMSLYNLLEEVVVRRTRQFIRDAYPEATYLKKQPDGTKVPTKISFPKRRLKTEEYNLEATYAGIYDTVVSGIESLNLAPYNLESYKKVGVEVDEWEAGRQVALVGIFKSRYLKRFESSVHAFRISVRRALEFQQTFESYILDGRALRSPDFHKAMQHLAREDEEDDATPSSVAAEIDANEEARAALADMEEVDPHDYDLRRLHEAVQHDIRVLLRIWDLVKDIKSEQDAKLAKLKELVAGPLKGKKVLIFSYYMDTERYLHRELAGENERARSFLDAAGHPRIQRMDSGVDVGDRKRRIIGFAPKANNKPDIAGTGREIDILISTDVLSEGQNLQDCAHLINYDLHWNPTRMVQRAGRIDRIGTPFKTLYIHNMFPDEGLERLLRLVERLMRKITDIDKAGFLDASVLGETVHPRNFNTLRRIREEDGSVIEEEEQFTELVSNEFLLQQLRNLLDAQGGEELEALPDGIHSGLAKARAKGVFFYFQAETAKGKQHFWRYYNLNTDQITDNRYLIANLIACQPDTPRVVGDYDIFKLQDAVIEDILKSFQEQQALEAAPTTIDPFQQTVATALQEYLSHPDLKRPQVLAAIKFVNRPMANVQLGELRALYRTFQHSGDVPAFVVAIAQMSQKYGEAATRRGASARAKLTRGDLRLICFDHLCS